MFVPVKRTGLGLRSVLLTTMVGLGACLVPSCLYDKDAPCGEAFEVYGDNERCVCPEGSLFTPQGCVHCGEHEVATEAGCECEPGFARPAAGEPCEAESGSGGAGGMATSGGGAAGDSGTGELGAECDPSAEPSGCVAPYDHCEPTEGGGYCTSAACASSEDCDSDFACNGAGVCQRPPTGQGQTCTSDADCEGLEASVCEPFTMTCHVPGCSLDTNDCFPGWECCDFTAFGGQPLCIPEGACML